MRGTWRAILAPVAYDEVPWAGASLRLGPLDRFDRFAVALIALVFLVLLVNIRHLNPSMPDTWYHANVAQQFLDDRGISGWDTWNFAPDGRPHLYPPVLHLVLAGLAALAGGVLNASRICATLFLPAALLTAWYAARRLVDSRVALLAVLLMLTDFVHYGIMTAHIAGGLINILLPLFLVAFLARRAWWAIALLTLMLYSHLGFPICVIAGLLLFGLKYRGYGRLALKVAGLSLLFFTPWLAHVLQYHDWLAVVGHGGIPGGLSKKLLSLQTLNLLVLSVGLWGAVITPRRQPQRAILIYMLIGFLPILFSYGGRYAMHTLPLWATLGATAIAPLLPAGASLRRAAVLALATLLPWPSVRLYHPEVLPLTTPHMLGLLTLQRGPGFERGGPKSQAYLADCYRMADWLRRNTPPDEVIYTDRDLGPIAEMIALLARRRTDFGGWWECSKRTERIAAQALRDSGPTATFAYLRRPTPPGMLAREGPLVPGVDRTIDLGRFSIGLRDRHWLARTGVPVTAWRTIWSDRDTTLKRGPALRWTFPARRGEFAGLIADVPASVGDAPPGTFAGAKLSLASSAVADDLVFGVRMTDGRDYRWPLALPYAGTPTNIRVIFAWMQDANGEPYREGKIAQVYLTRPANRPTPRDGGTRTVDVLRMEVVEGGKGTPSWSHAGVRPRVSGPPAQSTGSGPHHRAWL